MTARRTMLMLLMLLHIYRLLGDVKMVLYRDHVPGSGHPASRAARHNGRPRYYCNIYYNIIMTLARRSAALLTCSASYIPTLVSCPQYCKVLGCCKNFKCNSVFRLLKNIMDPATTYQYRSLEQDFARLLGVRLLRDIWL